MGDTQWEELDGDGYLLKVKGQAYVDIADAIVRSMGALNNITDQIDNKSLAMDKTRKVATDVRDSIQKAEGRYRETGGALVDYGTTLVAAKSEADPAAQMLRTLHDEYDAAQASASAAEDAVDDLPDNASAADKDDAERQAAGAGSEASRIADEIAKYKTQWQGGKDDKDTGARDAVSRIDEQFEKDENADFTDGFWDDVGQVWDAIGKWVKMVCDIAGILAIFLSWVPILGQILLVLAAIGSIIAIVEGIVKMANEGFSWGALIGVVLGVMGLVGGKAIGAVAKYAKARSVVQTSATMSSRAAKLKFGGTMLKSSRRTLAMTKGQRVTSVLKEPFKRTATDKKIWGLMKHGEGGKAFSTWRGAKFPLPYKDGAMRFAMGNDDTIDMMKHFTQSGLRVDNVTQTAQSVAILGSVTNQFAGLGNNMYKLGNNINGGNGWGIAGDSSSIATNPAGGSYGTIGSFATKYGAML